MDKKEIKRRRRALIIALVFIASVALSIVPTFIEAWPDFKGFVNENVDSGKTENDKNGKIDAKASYESSKGKKHRIKYDFINEEGETLATRINTPKGYTRTEAATGSLTEFIRNYHMEADGTPVYLYNGGEKKSKNHVAVFSMKLGNRDLQQCADSVIRMYAEYMRSASRDNEIVFHFTNGFKCDWNSYKAGRRVTVSGNNVSWGGSGPSGNTDQVFESYLNIVFNYAGTASMERECKKISEADVRVGDVVLKGGSPGHVVMVVDTCEKDGKKAFLLAQGYMPAQQFHVLKNPAHKDDPWYYVDEIKYPFRTPEWLFGKGSFFRPEYLKD